jgi:hypothetical protein
MSRKEGGKLGKLDVECDEFVQGCLDRSWRVQNSYGVEVLQGTADTFNVLLERVFRRHAVDDWFK